MFNVKFNLNKFQDNLLSKRLKQLDDEEMKARLKHQRTSNDLVTFLRECQNITGYHSSSRSNLQDPETMPRRFSDASSTSSSTFNSNSSSSRLHKNLKLDYLQDEIDQLDSNLMESTESKMNVFNSRKPRIVKSAFACKIPLFEQFEVNQQRSCSNQTFDSKISASSRSDKTNATSDDSFIDPDNMDMCIDHLIRPVTCANIKQAPKERYFKNGAVSNLDWSYNFDMNSSRKNSSIHIRDFNPLDSSSKNNINATQKTNKINKIIKINKPTVESNKHTNTNDNKQKPVKTNEFQSKSLNLLFSNETFKNFEEKVYSRKNSIASDSSGISSLSNFSNGNDREMANLNNKHSDTTSKMLKKSVKPKQVFPIKVNMTKSLMKKKQQEIMNEYKECNNLEKINKLRQIQKNLDSKVKQFTCQASFDI